MGSFFVSAELAEEVAPFINEGAEVNITAPKPKPALKPAPKDRYHVDGMGFIHRIDFGE